MDYNSVDSIIGGFTKILALANMGGPPGIAAIIILSGIPRRPGLSAIKMANNVIAKKSEAGLPVGALPSGAVAPDELMERFRMQEIVRAIQEDLLITVVIPPGITLNAYGIGPTGPVTVFGSTIYYAKGYGVAQ